MPIRYRRPSSTPETPPATGLVYRRPAAPPPTPDDEGLDPSGLVGAGILATAGAIATRNPQMAASTVGKLARMLNVARMTSMLSGLAVPKSILGNVGAVAVESAERRTLEPLRQLFSKQTVQGFKQALRTGGQVGPVPGASRMNPFGRVMGAADMATRDALIRAGLTPTEAERAVLQAPLGQLGEAMESPAGQYLVPFRRTPFNQFIEGMRTLKGEHPVVLAASTGAGAVHGAATSDEQYPVSLGLGTAAAARYGMPYAIGAFLGRRAAGAKTGGGITSAVLPVSEYGIESALDEPLKPITEPAGYRALRRLLGME